jgi:hypothetical protein
MWPFWLFAGIGVPSLAAYLRWRVLLSLAVEARAGAAQIAGSAASAAPDRATEAAPNAAAAPEEAPLPHGTTFGAQGWQPTVDSVDHTEAEMPAAPQRGGPAFTEAHRSIDDLSTLTRELITDVDMIEDDPGKVEELAPGAAEANEDTALSDLLRQLGAALGGPPR